MFKIVVFVSGNGSNLQALIDAQRNKILPFEVVHVICNQPSAPAIKRCMEANIPCTIFPRVLSGNNKVSRKEYDEKLLMKLNEVVNNEKNSSEGKKGGEKNYDLIVLAGWMHVLSDSFLSGLTSPIINLHPALPGAFPGGHAIEDAFDAFQKGTIEQTGIMIHNVVIEVDAGSVIEQMDIPIYHDDDLETLRNRISYFEKGLLLKAIAKLSFEHNKRITFAKVYSGKVRDIYDIGNGLIAMCATDRQSAFDRHICCVPGKGVVLNQSTYWWMKLTENIVPNHLVFCNQGRTMICKKAKRFNVEVVVRAYITGSTSTSLWTHYAKGDREYCGITFPDGLVKNQKLEYPIVTPTTKGIVDEPISADTVVAKGLMTEAEWNYVSEKALQLFNFGSEYAAKRGLILADTKYEFGKDENGTIILIDELHTCDSSRYWMLSSYNQCFEQGKDPESLDKDVVRRFISSKCDPYKEPLPNIPTELINNVREAYLKFYTMLVSEKFELEYNSNVDEQSDVENCIKKFRDSQNKKHL